MPTRILLDSAANDGNANSNANTQADDKGKATPPPARADPSKGYEAALKKHENDHAAMARQTYADSQRYRAERDEARAKLPKDGSLILTGDDAARWGELSKLGKSDEIQAQLEAGKAAASEVSAFRREKLYHQAATAMGFDADVLAGLPGVADLVIEIKDGQRNGKPARLAEIVTTVKDDKGNDVEKRIALDKYAETIWPKFLPALKTGAYVATPKGGGTPAPRQLSRFATGEQLSGTKLPERRRDGF